MLAFVIDPLVCHSAYWYLFPECWGVAVMSALPLALVCAYSVRKLAKA